ncbi:unnamed protein product [Paramecium primaurelia]|uniref:non-specific serine/threonine protein kinase n=1 Tax=Paramecium primaurelia TaxID=5886 RepID=A0A8S1LD94_PARPR|nr:unnamed protein product [Paramecium primaurelia]
MNKKKRLPEHPNIIKLIDYGEVKIQNKLFFCIVMELCEMNLQAMLSQEMLTERRIIEIFKQILDGLEVLHAEQISHRDLKLENIMIKRGTCKICDFGSASNNIIDLNLLSQIELNQIEEQFCKITTITYRPPEMIDVYKQQIIDAKVDIWQLGCILYNLCFRKSPFQDINKLSIAQAEFEIPQSQLSKKTLLLIQKMLQQDPKKRPNLKELKLFLYSRQIDDYDSFQ